MCYLSFDYLQFSLSLRGEGILPFIPHVQQFICVLFVQLIHIIWIRLFRLDRLDWFADHNVDWAAIRHNTYIVIEDACETSAFKRMDDRAETHLVHETRVL